MNLTTAYSLLASCPAVACPHRPNMGSCSTRQAGTTCAPWSDVRTAAAWCRGPCAPSSGQACRCAQVCQSGSRAMHCMSLALDTATKVRTAVLPRFAMSTTTRWMRCPLPRPNSHALAVVDSDAKRQHKRQLCAAASATPHCALNPGGHNRHMARRVLVARRPHVRRKLHCNDCAGQLWGGAPSLYTMARTAPSCPFTNPESCHRLERHITCAPTARRSSGSYCQWRYCPRPFWRHRCRGTHCRAAHRDWHRRNTGSQATVAEGSQAGA